MNTYTTNIIKGSCNKVLDVEKDEEHCPGPNDVEQQLLETKVDELGDDNKDVPEYAAVDQDKELPFTTIEKMIVDDKGVDSKSLPKGWSRVTHHSGLPLYVHRETCVCTLSEPYFIGTCDILSHQVPLASLPGSAYKRAVEEDLPRNEDIDLGYHKTKSTDKCFIITKLPLMKRAIHSMNESNDQDIRNVSDFCKKKSEEANNSNAVTENMGQSSDCARNIEGRVKVSKVADMEKHLTKSQIISHCKKLYKFKANKYSIFKRWPERLRYNKVWKTLFNSVLAERSQLFRYTIGKEGAKEDETLNMANLSKYPIVLHEYLLNMHKTHLYQYKQTGTDDTPYNASVYVSGELCGTANGSDKKHARALASRAAFFHLVSKQERGLAQEVQKELVEKKEEPEHQSEPEPDTEQEENNNDPDFMTLTA